jgi:ribose transport system substrate-binding protein
VGIYATNDPEAIGAVQALAEAGKEGVTIVGFNGDAPALELVKSGDMAATIRQDPYGQGKAAVEAALTLLDGQPLTYSDEATKSIYFPVEVVTADNVDALMAPAE